VLLGIRNPCTLLDSGVDRNDFAPIVVTAVPANDVRELGVLAVRALPERRSGHPVVSRSTAAPGS